MTIITKEIFCFACSRYKKPSAMFSTGERSICNCCQSKRKFWANKAVKRREAANEISKQV